jgi:hypothetical protein
MRWLLRIVVRFGVALLCVAQPAFAFAVEPAADTPAPRIAASLSPIANFAYQLDCISGWLRSCGGREDYTRLWQSQFGVDAAQSTEVSAWRSAFSGSQDLLVRARIASFESTSIEDYLRKIDTLFARDRAAAVRNVVRAHYPAFEQWWNEASRANRDSRVTALQRALESPPLEGELPKLYRFFAVPADSSRVLHLALLYRPVEGEPQHTTGEFLGDDWSVA